MEDIGFSAFVPSTGSPVRRGAVFPFLWARPGSVVPQIFPKGLLAQPLAFSAPVRESSDAQVC
ncbi:MAG: hypothetical protein BCS36_05185 [Desulfovibrio sp. MES5]|nr:MAG: hypothetical protein BCS36_05185 [Desulfovibrio sp. MES5]